MVLPWPGWLVWRAQGGLAKARALSELGLWDGAHRQLARYLWLHPGDETARLLMAEALIKDEQLPSEKSVSEALVHLGRISDGGENGPQARLQEGRLRLFIRGEPAQAERAFRRATELAPDSFVAWYLLWKTLDLSGRSQLAETEFWQVYELTPPEGRALSLREWYMSQFYPATASPQLDRLMGFVGAREVPTEMTEFRRLSHFFASEPREATTCAALARWFHLEGDPGKALQLLDEFENAGDNTSADPFYTATKIGVLFDLGEFERAEHCFASWPTPHAGHEYWKWRATLSDEVQGDGHAALADYDQALAVWPGPVDWRTRSRKANCLARLRDLQTAEAERNTAKQIEELMDDKTHSEIRAALGRLDDAAALNKVANFYRRLNRPREERCWRDEARRLETKSSPSVGDKK